MNNSPQEIVERISELVSDMSICKAEISFEINALMESNIELLGIPGLNKRTQLYRFSESLLGIRKSSFYEHISAYQFYSNYKTLEDLDKINQWRSEVDMPMVEKVSYIHDIYLFFGKTIPHSSAALADKFVKKWSSFGYDVETVHKLAFQSPTFEVFSGVVSAIEAELFENNEELKTTRKKKKKVRVDGESFYIVKTDSPLGKVIESSSVGDEHPVGTIGTAMFEITSVSDEYYKAKQV